MSGAPSAKVVVPLAYGQRADAAAAAVCRRLLEVIAANRGGALAGDDLEFLHRLRTSVRRSRTVQRQLAAAFPPWELHGFRSELRWLQHVTGAARDLDVHLHGFEDMRALVPAEIQDDLDPLEGVLEQRRLAAREEMAPALGSRRTDDLLADWEALLEHLVELPTTDRPAATSPIGELAGQRIGRLYERVVRIGAAIEDSSPPEAYHKLRKKGKELRYMLELFGTPLHPGEVVTPMVASLKALQDVLGRHQDREVQTSTLRSLAEEVATLPRGPRALMAMGVLVDRLAADEEAARKAFAERFAALASARQQQLVKATFASA